MAQPLFMKALSKTLGAQEKRVQTITTQYAGTFASVFGMNEGSAATRASIYSSPAAWRGIRIISDTIATMPLLLMRTLPDGSEVEATDHPLYDIIKTAPSPLYTSANWRTAATDRMVIDGNAVCKIYRDRQGRVKELQLIDQGRWNLTETEDSVTGRIKVRYQLPSQVQARPSQVLHLIGPTEDGLTGIGLLDYHSALFGLEDATRTYAEELWRTGAKPSGILRFPNALSDKAYARLKTSWQKEYGGVSNAGKTAIVEEGGEYMAVQLNPTDAGLTDITDQTTMNIARVLGIPPFMLGVLDEATFNNIEQLSLAFVRYTLAPWMGRWTGELDRKLLTPAERLTLRFKFDNSDLLKGTIETQVSAWVKLFNTGNLSRNEIRQELGRNPVLDGDRYWVQGNNLVPIDKVDELIEVRVNPPEEDLVQKEAVSSTNNKKPDDEGSK